MNKIQLNDGEIYCYNSGGNNHHLAIEDGEECHWLINPADIDENGSVDHENGYPKYDTDWCLFGCVDYGYKYKQDLYFVARFKDGVEAIKDNKGESLHWLGQLAKTHPRCRFVHYDIKRHMASDDLEKLYKAGFMDVSWGNDECASFYLTSENGGNADGMAIGVFLMDLEQTMGAAIPQYCITYSDLVDDENPDGIYDDINDAISAYHKFLNMEDTQ